MALFRVFTIPPPSGELHFAQPQPMVFEEHDWFTDDAIPDMTVLEKMDALVSFISAKRYFDTSKSWLVMSPELSFTINYHAKRGLAP